MVPRPTALVQVTDPPCCRTMLKTTARPRPVPARSGLVVKNGSKTRSTTSGGMPLPESVTVTATHGPTIWPGGAARSAGTTSVRMRRRAAVRHGIAGVDAQVHQHLIELRRVAFGERHLAVVRQLEGDPLGQDAMQQRGQAAQAVAEVDGLERQRVRAADGEELPRQQRAALGGAGDRVQLLADQRILRAGRGQAGAGQDDRQQVGEVVRDAAGEQAEALELLGAVEARLELALLVLGGAAQLGEADARGGHRDLAAHRHQVLDLLDAWDADAFVAEGAAAERAEAACRAGAAAR